MDIISGEDSWLDDFEDDIDKLIYTIYFINRRLILFFENIEENHQICLKFVCNLTFKTVCQTV